ncbi:hypothetical protein SLEP1_g41587 [Rubroshorea leprosula]|nr:hypothetical protein SLEP1_g41587 [Rubroshorea leprosula]
MGAETAQEAWDTLKKEFDGNARVKDRKVVEKIIVSVPDKFESKISAIEESCDLKELTIIELISKLQAHEQRLVMKIDETTEGAFLVRQKGKQPATSSESNKTMGSNQAYQQHQQSRKGKFPPCCYCRKSNHEEKDCWFKGKSQIGADFVKNMAILRRIARLSNNNSIKHNISKLSTDQSNNSKLITLKITAGRTTCSQCLKVHLCHPVLGNGTVVRSQGKGTAVIQTKTEVDDDSSVLKTKSVAEIYARCNLASAEPNCFEEAAKQQVWIDAMKEELSMIEKNQTWCLVPKLDDKKPIGVKWVFRTKLNPDGSIHKHKARLVMKRYAQQPRVDYGETYAPVARHDTVRLLIALAANLGWKLFHMDIKSAFLNGVLQEEIYVDQPPGIDDYLMSQGFKKSTKEATLYVKGNSNESQLILSLYVDDLLLTRNDLKSLEQFKKVMMQEFAITDLGETKYFLGLEVQQLSKGIFICQRKYALDILKKFEMENCKPVATPLVQYEKLSKDDQETKVMLAHSKLHLVAAKRVLRYIKGTYELGLWFDNNQQGRLQGYADSDWAGFMEDMISTTGYVFSFSSGSFSWNSKKQDVVAQSTAEAKY